MNIQYKTSKKAKNLRITVKDDQVIVTKPFLMMNTQAEAFVRKNVSWIEKKLAELKEKNKNKVASYQFGSEFKTKMTTLRVLESDLEKPYLKQHRDFLGLYLPGYVNIEEDHWQALIKGQIEEQLRREAKHYLVNRTHEIAKIKGIEIGKVSIRITKSRWGSCSSRNDISLSAYCMTLPDELIDYVIFHELAHVKVKNHSNNFWNHLESLLPGALKLDREMKKYSTGII